MVPVIPGVLPIQTYASFVRVTKLCGTYIPDAIQADLEPIQVSLTYCTTFLRVVLTSACFILAR